MNQLKRKDNMSVHAYIQLMGMAILFCVFISVYVDKAQKKRIKQLKESTMMFVGTKTQDQVDELLKDAEEFEQLYGTKGKIPKETKAELVGIRNTILWLEGKKERPIVK